MTLFIEYMITYVVTAMIHAVPLCVMYVIMRWALKRYDSKDKYLAELAVVCILAPFVLSAIGLFGESRTFPLMSSQSKTLSNLNVDPLVLGCGDMCVFVILHMKSNSKRMKMPLRLILGIALTVMMSFIVYFAIPALPE